MAVTFKYAYKTGQSMLGGYNSNEESNLVMTGYKKNWDFDADGSQNIALVKFSTFKES